jgi:hypothetical protein
MAETAAPPRAAGRAGRGPAYDQDFFLWTQRQAALIRAGQDRRELGTRLKILTMHLLKWQCPQKRSRSWRVTINDQRDEIDQLLEEDPSLRREIEELIGKRYRTARANAAAKTGLALRMFPPRCPYTADQVLDDTYSPAATDDE